MNDVILNTHASRSLHNQLSRRDNVLILSNFVKQNINLSHQLHETPYCSAIGEVWRRVKVVRVSVHHDLFPFPVHRPHDELLWNWWRSWLIPFVLYHRAFGSHLLQRKVELHYVRKHTWTVPVIFGGETHHQCELIQTAVLVPRVSHFAAPYAYDVRQTACRYASLANQIPQLGNKSGPVQVHVVC